MNQTLDANLDQFKGKTFGVDVSFDDIRRVTHCSIINVVPPDVFVTADYMLNRARVYLRTGGGQVGEIDRVEIG